MFPDPDMPGIDLVLPEFTYLYDRKDRVDGIVLTHGHEDHTGGLAFLIATAIYRNLPLGELLVNHGVISREELRDALKGLIRD